MLMYFFKFSPAKLADAMAALKLVGAEGIQRVVQQNVTNIIGRKTFHATFEKRTSQPHRPPNCWYAMAFRVRTMGRLHSQQLLRDICN